MTSPAVDTGIVAFIKARLAAREAVTREILDQRPYRILGKWMLAEVAKDRPILARHHAMTDEHHHAWCAEDGRPYPCQTVRLLAAIDADHPDYDPSWKPVAG